MAAASPLSKIFTQLSSAIAHAAGRPLAFLLCLAVVVAWAASGPIFSFSDTWQLVINTGTTIVTFLMVFLIQNTQNRDNAAVQTKLDELIRASAAQNAFVGIEHLTDEELEDLRRRCEERAKREGRELDKNDRARVAGEAAQERVSRKASAAF